MNIEITEVYQLLGEKDVVIFSLQREIDKLKKREQELLDRNSEQFKEITKLNGRLGTADSIEPVFGRPIEPKG